MGDGVCLGKKLDLVYFVATESLLCFGLRVEEENIRGRLLRYLLRWGGKRRFYNVLI